MRYVFGWLGAVVLLAACSGGASTSTTTTTEPPGAAGPAEAVTEWLGAVASGDGAGAGDVVVADHLALLVALENGLEPARIADLLRVGVDATLQDAYWDAFAGDFEEFAGAGIGEVTVQEVEEFSIDDSPYAAVEIGFPTRIGSTQVIVLQDDAGAWWVDLTATFGPSLVRPLRELLAALGPDADGTVVRTALGDTVPSLRAALEHLSEDDLPTEFVSEVESLIALLDRASG